MSVRDWADFPPRKRRGDMADAFFATIIAVACFAFVAGIVTAYRHDMKNNRARAAAEYDGLASRGVPLPSRERWLEMPPNERSAILSVREEPTDANP